MQLAILHAVVKETYSETEERVEWQQSAPHTFSK